MRRNRFNFSFSLCETICIFTVCVLKSPQRYNNNTRGSGNYKSILFSSSRYFGIFRQQAGEAQVDHVIDLGQSLCRAPSFTVGVAQRQQVMAEKDEEIVFKKVRAGLSPFCCDYFQMVLWLCFSIEPCIDSGAPWFKVGGLSHFNTF